MPTLAQGDAAWSTGGGVGVALWAFSQKHKVKLLEVYKNIKIPPAILSCNIHVDTTETTMSIFGGGGGIFPVHVQAWQCTGSASAG